MNLRTILSNTRSIFSEYLSTTIPSAVSNVLWTIYNGLQGVLEHLEWKVDTFIRENNFLTAQHTSSLRALAAMNGYEPQLPQPSRGICRMTIANTLYNVHGYPLYITPYTTFRCKENGLTYYYPQDRPLQLTNNIHDIELVEGEPKNMTIKSDGSEIFRVYIKSQNIAHNSISVIVDNTICPEVKSFQDSQLPLSFVQKFSHDPQQPVVLYIKGTNPQSVVDITYNTTYGTLGNIENPTFEPSRLLTVTGEEITPTSANISCIGIEGFNLASDGTSKDLLRASIGYNHSTELLYSNSSIYQFVSQYSTLRVQNITNTKDNPSHNIIEVYRKQVLTTTDCVEPYKKAVRDKSWILSPNDTKQLSDLITEREYCLTSHEIQPPAITRYAFQIKYESLADKNRYQKDIDDLIYGNFARLLFQSHEFSINILLDEFKKANNINIEYYMFSENNQDSYMISNKFSTLPILQGNFKINDTDSLFCDINHVI